MKSKSEEFKTAMAIIRERIATAKRSGPHGGFIDYHGYISVCHDFINILEDEGKAAEQGNYAFAYSVAALIQINCAKLAGTADDAEKKIESAEDLLFRFDIRYYDVLKELLSEKGVWEQEYSGLLTRIGDNLPYHMYMGILSKEKEIHKLLNEVHKYPATVFTYGKHLSAEFPDAVYEICLDEIRKQAVEADNRIKYKKVCGSIKNLFEYGGVVEADNIIVELKEKYPRRPAFLDELNSLTVKLSKKRHTAKS